MPNFAAIFQARPPGSDRYFYGWTIVGVGMIVAFSSGPGQSFVFSIFIDSIIEDTDLSRTTISAIYAVGTGISAMMVAIVSRLSDRYGPRLMLILVAIAFSAACFGMALATGLVLLFVSFSALRALGQGSLTINATLLVNQWFVQRRGRAIAIMGLGFPLSNAVLPPLSRYLIDNFGWREAYVVLGVLVLVLITVPVALFARNTPEDVGLHPDGADAPPAHEVEMAARGIDAHNRRVLTSATFWMLALPLSTPGLVVTALIFHQTSIFDEHGLSKTLAASVFVVFAAASTPASLIAGFVIERAGSRAVFTFSMVTLLIVLGLALSIESPALAIVYAFVTGISTGSGRIVQGVLWADFYGRQGLGRVQGSAMMVTITGAAIGPLPLAMFQGATGSYTLGIVVMMVLPVLSIIGIWTARAPNLIEPPLIVKAP